MTALFPAAAISSKDRLELRRDRRMLLAVLLMLTLAIAAVVASYARIVTAERENAAAAATERASWLGQGARDPHSAAHFAQWTFRPLDGPTLLDPGATPYAGTAIWLEAHARNPSAFRPVEERATTLDLGEFSPAWVLQTLGPLLAFLLAAGIVARERERGTLRLMLAAGSDGGRIVDAKTRGLLATMGLISVPVLAAGAAAVAMAPVAPTIDALWRTILWTALHLAWLGLAVVVGVMVSARARSTAGALVVLVSLWAVSVPLAPRLVASVAELAHPTPSGGRFWAEAQAEARDGFDGSGTQEERVARLRSDLLARYGVSRVEELPVSFRGASLDLNERFANRVFERRFAMLDAIHADQRRVMRMGALLSPLIAVQNASAALTGTDNRHLRAFDLQAEAARQDFVNALNRDLTLHGAGRSSYQADPSLWASFEPFRAVPLSVRDALASSWPDLLILLGWLVSGMVLLRGAQHIVAREVAR